MSYTREERRRVETILARAAYLHEQTIGAPHRQYDLAELGAIKWLLGVALKLHGPLPEELERLRVSIWPI